MNGNPAATGNVLTATGDQAEGWPSILMLHTLASPRAVEAFWNKNKVLLCGYMTTCHPGHLGDGLQRGQIPLVGETGPQDGCCVSSGDPEPFNTGVTFSRQKPHTFTGIRSQPLVVKSRQWETAGKGLWRRRPDGFLSGIDIYCLLITEKSHWRMPHQRQRGIYNRDIMHNFPIHNGTNEHAW